MMAKKRATPKNKAPSGRVDKRGRCMDNRGRPSTYDPEFHPQAAKVLCSKGATIAELADAFGVAISTIWQWKASHAEFSESFRLGAEDADERVERSFYERAVGYTHDSVKIFMPAGADAPVIVPYREHVAPDPRACEFWLTNRRPERWKHKQTLEHETPPDDPIRLFAQQLMGTAIRPRMPEPVMIEHAADEPRGIRPRHPQSLTSVTTTGVTTGDAIEAEPVEPRIHTVSPQAYEDGEDGA